MVGHLAQGLCELGIDQRVFVSEHQVFEGVKEVRFDLGNILILRKHQRQFLLVHQHARWDRCDDVVAIGNRLREHGDVRIFHFFDFFQIAKFQFWHATAFCILQNFDGDIVVLEHSD